MGDVFSQSNFGQVVKGIVVNSVSDADHPGQIQVRVPPIHGPMSIDDLPPDNTFSYVEDAFLPWAEVLFPIGVASNILPLPGTIVYVMFTSTSYRRPLVLGTTGIGIPGSPAEQFYSSGYVNFGLGVVAGDPAASSAVNAEATWKFFKEEAQITNDFAIAGIMGNLYGESAIQPQSVEGDIPMSNKSINYMATVDAGQVSEDDFVYHSPHFGKGCSGRYGLGLAGFTYYTIKQSMYRYWKRMRSEGDPSRGIPANPSLSIGDLTFQLRFLWYDQMCGEGYLSKEYISVKNKVLAATSVVDATSAFLYGYERPAVQDKSVLSKRASYGQAYYDKFHS